MGLPSWVRSVKSRAVRAAGPIGLYRLAHLITRQRPRIFMYHRFAERDSEHRIGRETFRRQIRLLKSVCRVVTLRELADALRTNSASASGMATITVDDGYKDFHDHAWPVLIEEGVSATFFPVTGFLDGELWLWPDLVEYVLQTTSVSRIEASDLALPSRASWSLTDSGKTSQAWQAIVDHAIDLPDRDKWIYLRDLYRLLGVPWPAALPDRYAPVTWEQLESISSSGIEIGTHTRTHCRLTRVGSEQLVDELAGAKARLEAQLKTPVVSLCYPNGSAADYDENVMAAAERTGYKSAVTAYFDGRRGDLYDLRRHAATHNMFEFQKCLWGVEDLSRRANRAIARKP